MESVNDSPGVHIPPPLIYAAIFFLSLFIQKLIPLDHSFFNTGLALIFTIALLLLGLSINVPAFRQFFKSKNNLSTLKPAFTLQTSGIYSVTRNPIYLSFVLIYSGLAFWFGNWWTILLLPVLIGMVTYLVIQPEEKYLERKFGTPYQEYKLKVRRWI